jgi:hypothetical protein
MCRVEPKAETLDTAPVGVIKRITMSLPTLKFDAWSLIEPEPQLNPNVIVIPTNDPGATEAEYRALGWNCCDLLARPWHIDLCRGKQWAIRFWRPEPLQQRNLI